MNRQKAKTSKLRIIVQIVILFVISLFMAKGLFVFDNIDLDFSFVNDFGKITKPLAVSFITCLVLFYLASLMMNSSAKKLGIIMMFVISLGFSFFSTLALTSKSTLNNYFEDSIFTLNSALTENNEINLEAKQNISHMVKQVNSKMHAEDLEFTNTDTLSELNKAILAYNKLEQDPERKLEILNSSTGMFSILWYLFIALIQYVILFNLAKDPNKQTNHATW